MTATDDTTAILEHMTTDDVANSIKRGCRIAVQGIRCERSVMFKVMLESKRSTDREGSLTDSVTLLSLGAVRGREQDGREMAISIGESTAEQMGIECIVKEDEVL